MSKNTELHMKVATQSARYYDELVGKEAEFARGLDKERLSSHKQFARDSYKKSGADLSEAVSRLDFVSAYQALHVQFVARARLRGIAFAEMERKNRAQARAVDAVNVKVQCVRGEAEQDIGGASL